jgi:Tol biopolymer transport system component
MNAAQQSESGGGRRHAPGQWSTVWVAPLEGDPFVVLESTDLLVEAPNWSGDGRLVVNGGGRLWSLPPTHGAGLSPIAIDGVSKLNNDHVLAPNGDDVFVTSDDGHLYVAPLSGGTARRLTDDRSVRHYLHGVSSDGATLAFVELPCDHDGRDPQGRLGLVSAAGGEVRHIDTGDGHLDGPEFTPDGEWIVFNSDAFTDEPGHAQLGRVRVDGSGLERLVESDTVDWFPHLSPDGRFASYVSFPPGTIGHPADVPVTVNVVSTEDWSTPIQSYQVFGGQGTLNVNSWSPDSDALAFVEYPLRE